MAHSLTITIPHLLLQKTDLVVIPRSEYEALYGQLKKFKSFVPSPAQKKALIRAERNLRQGKTLSSHEFVSKLGITD